MAKIEYSDEQIENLLRGIHSGTINPFSLPRDLYEATATYLNKGVGIGVTETVKSFGLGEVDEELIKEMNTNIYIFSAAKTFQQVKQMGDLLLDGDNLRSFEDFKNDASVLFSNFNEAYAQAEYNTAIGMAQNGVRWNQIEARKNVLPYLRYSAVMDDNTSDICAGLNDKVAAINDSFWDDFMPPNHFNCRCVVEQLDDEEGSEKEMSNDEQESVENNAKEQMQPIFLMNSGKDKIVFKDDHPYFDVQPKYRDLAKRNFDLPIPNEE